MSTPLTKKDLVKIADYLWEVPVCFRKDMKVPARIYASESMLDEVFKDRSLWQLVNLSTLKGVYKYVLVMPDVHEGYGAPIGGICPVLTEEGVISPGLIGYDINCGIRLLRSDKSFVEIKDLVPKLTQTIYQEVPSGVGRGGWLKLSNKELDKALETGVDYALSQGWATEQDKEFCESGGRLNEA
ncbi:MAG: RtcB family protein, partial [Patescibacteria group bacterium]